MLRLSVVRPLRVCRCGAVCAVRLSRLSRSVVGVIRFGLLRRRPQFVFSFEIPRDRRPRPSAEPRSRLRCAKAATPTTAPSPSRAHGQYDYRRCRAVSLRSCSWRLLRPASVRHRRHRRRTRGKRRCSSADGPEGKQKSRHSD